MQIPWNVILIRALDLITIVVPPALPATLTIGTTFAIGRLRKTGIFCISPNRVNIGGKVNVFCFDKTGTLTEEGLDVLGVRTIDRREHRFSELHGDVTDVPNAGGIGGKTPLLYALATCHALKLVNGEIIGDPLDIKMFQYTGWTLDEGKAAKPPAPGKDGAKAVERPQTLVQTVVRPPGTDRWRLEDALRTGGKVCWTSDPRPQTLIGYLASACSLPRVGRDPAVRLCLRFAANERRCQASESYQHGNIRQGRARSHARHLRSVVMWV